MKNVFLVFILCITILISSGGVFAYNPTNEDKVMLQKVKTVLIKLQEDDPEKIKKIKSILPIAIDKNEGKTKFLLEGIYDFLLSINTTSHIEVFNALNTEKKPISKNVNKVEDEYIMTDAQADLLNSYKNKIIEINESSDILTNIDSTRELYDMALILDRDNDLRRHKIYTKEDLYLASELYIKAHYEYALEVNTVESYKNTYDLYLDIRQKGGLDIKNKLVIEIAKESAFIVNEVEKALNTKIRSSNLDENYYFTAGRYHLNLNANFYRYSHFSIKLLGSDRSYKDLIVNETGENINSVYYFEIDEPGYYLFDANSSSSDFYFTISTID